MTRHALMAIFIVATTAAFGSEFSLTEVVRMSRKLPPSTNAGASLVRVTVTSEREEALAGAEKLKRSIEDFVQSGRGTLATRTPEITIDVSLVGSEMEDAHGLNVTGTWKIVAHGVDIASGSFDRKPMWAAATEISGHLVPSTESVPVRASIHTSFNLGPMPIDRDSYLSTAKAKRVKDAEEESYRKYAIALVKEAQAYDEWASRETSLELLRSAIDHLEHAIRLNPNETRFTMDHYDAKFGNIGDPLSRMKDSLARYEKWIPQPVRFELETDWSPCPLPAMLLPPPDRP